MTNGSNQCRRSVLCGLFFAAHALVVSAQAAQKPDFTQADAMLDLLRSCAAGRSSAAQMDRALALPGTQLVVQQQNISRAVTMEQYRRVLEAACEGKVVALKAQGSGTRAQRGIEGLTQDVGPSLVWGRGNISLLEARLEELRRNRSIADALPLTRKYLPEAIPLAPRFYVVMGGRAGAAAIEDQLCFDVLSSAWRSSVQASRPTSPAEVVEFFAHEAHHLGYGQILDRKRSAFRLNPAEDQAWKFLSAILMEGSATLLINGHETMADVKKMPDFPPYLAKVPELLPAMQDLLRKALAGPVPDEEYDRADAEFLGMGYHAAGATLLDAIHKARGLKGVIEVMADPRQLLTAYNASVSAPAGFRFDPQLATHVARLGQHLDQQEKK